MNGLEAFDEMKKGKLVRDEDGLIYKIENSELLVNTSNDFNSWNVAIVDFSKKFEVVPEHITGWERVAKGDCYYQLHALGYSVPIEEHNDNYDNNVYDCYNYFSTKEKANEINFKQTLFRKLKRFADEHNEKIDWCDPDSYKFYIYYDYGDGELRIHANKQVRRFGVVYFSSSELAEQAIELFNEDLLKYFNYDAS